MPDVKPRRLVLDRQHLIAMVVDPEFYVTCPAFLSLRNAAMTAHVAYKASKGCCGSDWKHMLPVIDEFFARLQTANVETLAAVKGYLGLKKNCVISPVVLYYRRARSGKPAKYTF